VCTTHHLEVENHISFLKPAESDMLMRWILELLQQYSKDNRWSQALTSSKTLKVGNRTLINVRKIYTSYGLPDINPRTQKSPPYLTPPTPLTPLTATGSLLASLCAGGASGGAVSGPQGAPQAAQPRHPEGHCGPLRAHLLPRRGGRRPRHRGDESAAGCGSGARWAGGQVCLDQSPASETILILRRSLRLCCLG